MARRPGKKRPFHERFGLDVGLDEARRQFTNRSRNYMMNSFFPLLKDTSMDERTQVLWRVANALGTQWEIYKDWGDYTGTDFHRHLAAIEVVYSVVPADLKKRLAHVVALVLEESPIDLGVGFRDGRFVRKGADILISA